MKIKIKNLTRGSFLIALGVLLPQVFHLFLGKGSGEIFLPMHIPVLLSGIILGPVYGLIIGMLIPLISSMFTGMPGLQILPLMISELGSYGLVIGLLYRKFKDVKYGCIISLIIAMIAGRIIYGVILVLLGSFFNIIIGSPESIIYAFSKGFPGVISQIVIIPLLIKGLRAGGYMEDNIKL